MTDVGQADAGKMYADAVSGSLRLDPGVAQACAEQCDRFADLLTKQLRVAQNLTHHDGFGSLASSVELQIGFNGKGDEAVTMIKAYQEATLRFKAAFLAAGQMFEGADEANQQALAIVDNKLSR